jgi:hypothetical protein
MMPTGDLMAAGTGNKLLMGDQRNEAEHEPRHWNLGAAVAGAAARQQAERQHDQRHITGAA